jgi:outer membrane protein TolC
MRSRLLLLLLMAIVPEGLGAQTAPPPLPLTLEEALSRGLASSRRVAELEARVEGSGFAVEARRAADRPAVALLGGYTRTNHVDEFAIAAPGRAPQVVYPDIPDNYRARLDLQWPIYSGGRTDALERAAAAERSAAGADLDAARADLRLEITRAFWALVTARETEAVLARSLDAINAQVNDLRNRLTQGLIPPNDVSSAEAEAAHERLLAVEAANLRLTADADLRRVTGIENTGPIEPVANTDVAPAAVQPSDTLVGQALKARPERRALEARASSADERVTAAAAAAKPQLTLAAGYDYARPNPRIFPRQEEFRTSWDLSANVSWSLWDAGRRSADQGEARATARALHLRVEDFDRQVTFEVRQRQLESASSVAAIAAADDEVRAAREAERVTTERNRVGVATSTDVLQAQVARLQAELDRTRAVANARVAQARLDRALGR